MTENTTHPPIVADPAPANAPLDELGRSLQKAARTLARRGGRDTNEELLERLSGTPRVLAERVLKGGSESISRELVASSGGERWAFRTLNVIERLSFGPAITLANALLERLIESLGSAACANFLVKMASRLRGPLNDEGRRLVSLCTVALGISDDGALDMRSAWLLVEPLVSVELSSPDPQMEERLKALEAVFPSQIDSEHRTYLEGQVEGRGHWSRRLGAIWLLASSGMSGQKYALEWLREAHNRLPGEALGALEVVHHALRRLEVDAS